MDFLQPLAELLDRPLFPWKKLILGFSIGQYVLETALTLRQYRVLRATKPPAVLAGEFSQHTFDRSQAYGRAKARFGLVSGLWSQLCNVVFVQCDVLPRLWALSGVWLLRWAPARLVGDVGHSIVFVLVFVLVQQLLGLPAKMYSTFVLEHTFGFNKQTPGLFVADLVKSNLVLAVVVPPVLAGFLGIIHRTGTGFVVYLWAFAAAVQLFAITAYPVFIQPLFNKLSPLEDGELKSKVNALAGRFKFPLSELYVIDGSKRSAHSNAFFYGLPWKKHIVIYDTLLEKSETDEVLAILGHELGHWKLGHTTRLFVISQVNLLHVFTLFSVFINNRSLYAAFGFDAIRPIVVGFILFSDALAPMDTLLQLGLNTLSRRFEFEADDFARSLGLTSHLSTALIKLHKQNLSTMDADWMYASYHFSHPHLSERLKALGWESTRAVVKEEKKDGVAKVSGRDEL